VDLTGYQPFDARVAGPLRDAPREVAEDHFARLMAARAERRAELAALWRRHGGPAAPDALDAPDAPARLGAWLAAALAAAGAGGVDPLTGPDAAAWTGVIADVALWLGDRIVARGAAAGAAVGWDLCTRPPRATGYHRPVLVGFRRPDDPRYYVDVAHMVASWAAIAARGRPARPDFLATIEDVTAADA
jgi:hypothetical protein